MNYEIKQDFLANDLSVGDIMYDAENDAMVKVLLISDKSLIFSQKLFDSMGSDRDHIILGGNLQVIDGKVNAKQIVLEDANEGVVFTIKIVGEVNELPLMDNGKPRFRHLMKTSEPYIINWPVCPDYPTYPIYPVYPGPYYPNWWDYTGTPIVYCGQDSTECEFPDMTSGNVDFSNTVLNSKSNLNGHCGTYGVTFTAVNTDNEKKTK